MLVTDLRHENKQDFLGNHYTFHLIQPLMREPIPHDRFFCSDSTKTRPTSLGYTN
jgi:hypothetical protein